jgi:hypothetical protein
VERFRNELERSLHPTHQAETPRSEKTDIGRIKQLIPEVMFETQALGRDEAGDVRMWLGVSKRNLDRNAPSLAKDIEKSVARAVDIFIFGL